MKIIKTTMVGLTIVFALIMCWKIGFLYGEISMAEAYVDEVIAEQEIIEEDVIEEDIIEEVFVSEEYLAELDYNSKTNTYFGD